MQMQIEGLPTEVTSREWSTPTKRTVTGEPPGPDEHPRTAESELRRQNIRMITPIYKTQQLQESDLDATASYAQRVKSSSQLNVSTEFRSQVGGDIGDPDYKEQIDMEKYRLHIIDPKVQCHANMPAHGQLPSSKRKLNKFDLFPSFHSRQSMQKLNALDLPSAKKVREPIQPLFEIKPIPKPPPKEALTFDDLAALTQPREPRPTPPKLLQPCQAEIQRIVTPTRQISVQQYRFEQRNIIQTPAQFASHESRGVQQNRCLRKFSARQPSVVKSKSTKCVVDSLTSSRALSAAAKKMTKNSQTPLYEANVSTTSRTAEADQTSSRHGVSQLAYDEDRLYETPKQRAQQTPQRQNAAAHFERQLQQMQLSPGRSWRRTYAVPPLDELRRGVVKNRITSSAKVLQTEQYAIDFANRQNAFVEKPTEEPTIQRLGRTWQPPPEEIHYPVQRPPTGILMEWIDSHKWLPHIWQPEYKRERKSFTPCPSPPRAKTAARVFQPKDEIIDDSNFYRRRAKHTANKNIQTHTEEDFPSVCETSTTTAERGKRVLAHAVKESGESVLRSLAQNQKSEAKKRSEALSATAAASRAAAENAMDSDFRVIRPEAQAQTVKRAKIAVQKSAKETQTDAVEEMQEEEEEEVKQLVIPKASKTFEEYRDGRSQHIFINNPWSAVPLTQPKPYVLGCYDREESEENYSRRYYSKTINNTSSFNNERQFATLGGSLGFNEGFGNAGFGRRTASSLSFAKDVPMTMTQTYERGYGSPVKLGSNVRETIDRIEEQSDQRLSQTRSSRQTPLKTWQPQHYASTTYIDRRAVEPLVRYYDYNPIVSESYVKQKTTRRIQDQAEDELSRISDQYDQRRQTNMAFDGQRSAQHHHQYQSKHGRRKKKSYSSHDLHRSDVGNDPDNTFLPISQREPIVEFPQTLPRSRSNSGGHRWKNQQVSHFKENAVERNHSWDDLQMAKLSNELESKYYAGESPLLLESLPPLGQNLNKVEYSEEAIPGGHKSMRQAVSARSGIQRNDDGLTQYSTATRSTKYKREVGGEKDRV